MSLTLARPITSARQDRSFKPGEDAADCSIAEDELVPNRRSHMEADHNEKRPGEHSVDGAERAANVHRQRSSDRKGDEQGI